MRYCPVCDGYEHRGERIGVVRIDGDRPVDVRARVRVAVVGDLVAAEQDVGAHVVGVERERGARQATNAYAFGETAIGARKPDYDNSNATTNLFKNKKITTLLPGLLPVQLALNLLPHRQIIGRTTSGVP